MICTGLATQRGVHERPSLCGARAVAHRQHHPRGAAPRPTSPRSAPSCRIARCLSASLCTGRNIHLKLPTLIWVAFTGNVERRLHVQRVSGCRQLCRCADHSLMSPATKDTLCVTGRACHVSSARFSQRTHASMMLFRTVTMPCSKN